MTPYIPLVHPVLQDRQGTLPGPVWVVDDDDVRDSIAFALQTRFNVVMHPSSDQLLSRAELSQPGCIIIDMHARGMNGLALSQCAAKPCFRYFPVIARHGSYGGCAH